MTTGNDTVYAQQYRILRRQNVQHPKPKQKFDEDIIHSEKWKKQ